MGFLDDHVRYVEHSAKTTKPYFQRNFLPPQYVGQDGEANFDTISGTIEKALARTVRLAKDEVQQPGATAKFDPQKPVDPLDFASKPTSSYVKTVELPLLSDVWNGSEPINYHCQVEVGTPPQTFYVDLDTGSSLFWLQSVLTPQEDSDIVGQSSYHPDDSLSARDLLLEDKAKYGDGDLVDVALYEDRVNVGKMSINSALIGAAATSRVKMDFAMSKANGILGLGFPTKPENLHRKNLCQMLYEQGMVRHPSFALIGPRVDPKLAEKIDKEVIMQPRGTFVIGSVDPAYYTGSIAWCPQIVSTNRWIVKLDKIVINGQVAFEDQLALIDTGTAYIVASPSNFDKAQKFIEGASPLPSKQNFMFTYPADNLKKVGFVFGGREIRLQQQDFGLGGLKSQNGKMCSSIVRLAEWDFPEHLWVIGGIFLDNVVTIFDYGERKIGFADISEKDLKEAGLMTAAPAPPTGAAVSSTTQSAEPMKPTPAPIRAPAPSVPEPLKLVAADMNHVEVSADAKAVAGREFSQLITFNQNLRPQIAIGFTSLNLSWQHPRLIAFATENTRDAFRLNVNASADDATHGVSPNPDSDTILRGGKAAWLRALPEDTNVQTGRYSIGTPYPKGKQVPNDNVTTIKFSRKFEKTPKVVLWLSAMDFSKSVNWRLKADVTHVTNEGFTMNAGCWQDTILYKADVTWIAHADVPEIQSGTFSTEDVRGAGWALNTAGSTKFGTPFAKPPRLVAGLNKIEFGCGRDMIVTTTTEADKDGINWSMNSTGGEYEAHQYITRASYIAFDPDLKTVSAAISS